MANHFDSNAEAAILKRALKKEKLRWHQLEKLNNKSMSLQQF